MYPMCGGLGYSRLWLRVEGKLSGGVMEGKVRGSIAGVSKAGTSVSHVWCTSLYEYTRCGGVDRR